MPRAWGREDEKGNCGLQLSACLAHGCPGDNNSRPAPLEEKGDEEEEEGKGEREKCGLQLPARPAHTQPGLQIPARPARPRCYRAPGAPPKVTDPPRSPSTAQPDTCTGAVYSIHNKGSAPPAPQNRGLAPLL